MYPSILLLRQKMTMNLDIKQTSEELLIKVKAQPGSSRTRISGLWNDLLKVNIACEAQKGKANEELIYFIAKILGLPKSSINIVAGLRSGRKTLSIKGLTKSQLIEKLETHLC
jgi:uncharacterized protein